MKSLKEFIVEGEAFDGLYFQREVKVKQLPEMEDILPGDNVILKIKGHTYAIWHREANDKSYGKYHIFKDGEPIHMIDYGPGHKFHYYDYEKKWLAYAAFKKFMDSL
jgi:hypothetical protein